MTGHGEHLGKTFRPLCVNLNVPFLAACDDDCVGVLLTDLDHVGAAILSVNLTGFFPVPYGILSNLENTTKSLRVGTGHAEVDRPELGHGGSGERSVGP